MKYNNTKSLMEIDNFYLEVSFNFSNSCFHTSATFIMQNYAEAILFHFIRVEHYAEAIKMQCNSTANHFICP